MLDVAAFALASEGPARLLRQRHPPVLSRVGLALLTRDERFDVTRAKADLGWEPRVTLEQGIRETAAWARQAFS